MALFQQGKSSLCHGQNAKKWLCATKANYDCAANGMLEGGFVLPRQIMFGPQMVYKIMVLRYLCVSHKTPHLCVVVQVTFTVPCFPTLSCEWNSPSVSREFTTFIPWHSIRLRTHPLTHASHFTNPNSKLWAMRVAA
jgi:hypothetical protein